MKKFPFGKAVLASITYLALTHVAHAACTVTLNPGANVATAAANAAAGSTICLNPGSYGTQQFTNVTNSGDVIIQSTTGQGASAYLSFWASNHLHFQNMTIAGADVEDNSTYLTFSNSVFTNQAVVKSTASGSTHITFTRNTFDGISVCTNCYEGRLQLGSGSGVVVSYNHFGGGGDSDGIQVNADGATIGPGNVFSGLVQGSNPRHIDSIQGVGGGNMTITGNFFSNDSMFLGFYDGASNLTITNNTFLATDDGNPQPIQLGSVVGLVFQHNTVRGNYAVAQGSKAGNPSNANASYTNNVFDGTYILDTAGTGGTPGCVSNCTYTANLFTSSGNARGTSNLIGPVTYVGGPTSTSWTGVALAPTSLGYHAAAGGYDMGTDYYGTSAVITVPVPTGLTAK